MASELSPQSEQYLQEIVATGVYPSKEAALEAAVAALREKNGRFVEISDEHARLIEEGLAASARGESRPMTDADWARLRQRAYDAAAKRSDSK